MWPQVYAVVNQLLRTVGGPVLVVARRHLAKDMDDGHLSLSHHVPSNQDFHLFTTRVNESVPLCVCALLKKRLAIIDLLIIIGSLNHSNSIPSILTGPLCGLSTKKRFDFLGENFSQLSDHSLNFNFVFFQNFHFILSCIYAHVTCD